MRAGKLRHRVAFQAPTENRNQFNEVVNGWSTVRECWASVEPLTGRELWLAQQVQPDVSKRVRCRWFPELQANWRILFKGKPMNIATVLNRDERNIEYEIHVQEAD